MRSTFSHAILASLTVCGAALAQNAPPETPYLNAILKRPIPPTQSEKNALDRNTDGEVDVRDLAVYLNGLPVSAYFETAESVAFRGDTVVPVSIRFSKPATGTIRISLGGTASFGDDFQAFESQVSGFAGLTTSVTVIEKLTHTLMIPIAPPNQDLAGERRLTLNLMAQATVTQGTGTVSVNRTGGISPGYRTSHTIVIRDAAKTWTGTMDFSPEAGLSSQSVRFMMDEQGATRMLIPDSVVFAGASYFQATAAPNGKLTLSTPISGNFSLPGETSDVTWTLALAGVAAAPGDPPSVASYQGTFTLQDFPIAGISKSSAVTLVLTSEN
jgi:hypothetical protein